VVSGRRRQGKSYLLEALCAAMGGFYFAATEATEAESLRQLADALADHLGMPAAPVLRDWEQAIDLLLALGRDAPVPVVLDEFPYLCASSPALPSIVQKMLGPRRAQRMESSTRLVLCGSAMTFMGGLLSGSAPLRGRAGLDLTVPTFDYRQAAEFWGLDDPHLAVRVHAVVGGTPAYRREYVSGDAPSGIDDFDPWVLRTVLNPAWEGGGPTVQGGSIPVGGGAVAAGQGALSLGTRRRRRWPPDPRQDRPFCRPARRCAEPSPDRAGGCRTPAT
jgi:uncharacterized protein